MTTLCNLFYRYLSTVDELMEYCSSIHLKTVLPDVLIVADFHLYLGHGQVSLASEQKFDRSKGFIIHTYIHVSQDAQYSIYITREEVK